MRHTCPALLLALLCLPFASAEVIFDDWVTSGDAFSVADQQQSADYLASRSMARIGGPLGYYTLEHNECEENKEYRFCFVGFDDAERVVYREGREYSALHITVERLEPAVTISRSLSESSIDLGSRAEISVTITNEGDRPAYNVRYEDVLPNGIAVISASGMERTSSSVRWEGVLSAKKSVSFKYLIEARGFVAVEDTATVSYVDNDQRKKVESPPLKIEVTPPFDIDQEFTPEEFGLNDEVSYKITLKKTFPRPIQVDKLLLTVPAGMQIIRTSRNWKAEEPRQYNFVGEITDTESFELKFRIPEKGSYDLVIELKMTAEGQTFSKQIDKPIRIGVSQLVPHISIEPQTVKGGQKYQLKAELENLAPEDIRADVDLSGKAMGAGLETPGMLISRRDTEEVFNKKLVAPGVGSRTPYTFTLSGEYVDEHEETLRFSESATLIVEPVPEAIAITAIPEYTSMPKEEKVQIKVFVRNIHTAALSDIEVADIVPRGINIVEGTPSTELALEPGQETLAYSYTVQALPEYRDAVLAVKTVANAELADGTLYSTETQTHVLFGELIPNLEFSNTATSLADEGPTALVQTEIVEGEPSTVPLPQADKKEGFFSRMWQWIRGIWD